jgi:hypothetical protein
MFLRSCFLGRYFFVCTHGKYRIGINGYCLDIAKNLFFVYLAKSHRKSSF